MARIELSNIGGGGTTLSLTTTGTSGASTLAGSVLNIPIYQGQLTLTTTGTSGAATLSGTTLNIPQYSGGGGTPAGSAGQVQFNSTPAGSFAASANLAWDNTNVRLNIGAPSSPTGRLNVKGSGTLATTNLELTNSGNTSIFKVLDNGNANFGTGLYWDNLNKRLSIDWATPLAPFVIRASRATQVFYSSGLTTPIPFTNTGSIGAWANGEFIGAINQAFGATGGLVLQGFTSAATSQAFAFQGHVGSTAPNAPALTFQGFRFDGVDSRTAMTGTESIANFQTGNTAGVGIAMGIKANATVNVGGDFTPSATVHVRGSNTSGGTNAFLVQNSTPSDIYKIENNGKVSYLANAISGTTGNQTINTPSGNVNFAAGATTLTVTNSLCTSSSLIFATVRTNDATATIKNVVPAAGSFTINLSAGATGVTSVGFFIIN
jgi:hypothetical protein